MAKLPGIDYATSVGSLGRERPGLALSEGSAAAGVYDAIADLSAMVGKEARNTYQRVGEHEAQVAAVQYEEASKNAALKATSKREWRLDEIPEGIEYDAKGRSSIPAEEIMNQIYAQETAGMREKMSERMRTEVGRNAFGLSSEKIHNRSEMAVRQTSAKYLAETLKGEALAAIQTLVNNGQREQAKQVLLSRGELFGPVETQEMLRTIEVESELAPMRNAIAAGDTAAMELMLLQLEAPEDEYTGALTETERAQAAGQLRAAIVNAENRQRSEVDRYQKEQFQGMDYAIASGDRTVGPEAIDNAYRRGDINGGQAATLLRRFTTAVGSDKEDHDTARDIAYRRNEGLPLDYTNTKHQKYLSKELLDEAKLRGHGSVVEALIEDPGYRDYVYAGIDQDKIVYKPVLSVLSSLNQGNPKHLAAAGEVLDFLQTTNNAKVLADQLTDKQAGDLLVAHHMRKYMTPAESAQWVIDSRSLTDADRENARRGFYNDYKQEDIQEMAEDVFESKFLFDTELPKPFVEEFEALWLDYYVRFGGQQPEATAKTAMDRMMHRYGETEINGEKQLIPFPPEDLAKLPTDLLKTEFDAQVEELSGEVPEGVFYAPHFNIDGQHWGAKTYLAWQVTEAGRIMPVNDRVTNAQIEVSPHQAQRVIEARLSEERVEAATSSAEIYRQAVEDIIPDPGLPKVRREPRGVQSTRAATPKTIAPPRRNGTRN